MNDVDMTDSSFPTIGYVMFIHILTTLCDVFDDLKNVYLTFCKIEHFILISSFMLKISFCFSEPCYIRLEI